MFKTKILITLQDRHMTRKIIYIYIIPIRSAYSQMKLNQCAYCNIRIHWKCIVLYRNRPIKFIQLMVRFKTLNTKSCEVCYEEIYRLAQIFCDKEKSDNKIGDQIHIIFMYMQIIWLVEVIGIMGLLIYM